MSPPRCWRALTQYCDAASVRLIKPQPIIADTSPNRCSLHYLSVKKTRIAFLWVGWMLVRSDARPTNGKLVNSGRLFIGFSICVAQEHPSSRKKPEAWSKGVATKERYDDNRDANQI